ncbi:MAG: HipA N-terminal domain-containing protein [Eubacteriales bacterium]|nr:HipA N-terminal domain-containing protein [Eubacteriales bacterium]
MNRYKKMTVFLEHQRVGTLACDAHKIVHFEYAPEWLQNKKPSITSEEVYSVFLCPAG